MLKPQLVPSKINVVEKGNTTTLIAWGINNKNATSDIIEVAILLIKKNSKGKI